MMPLPRVPVPIEEDEPQPEEHPILRLSNEAHTLLCVDDENSDGLLISLIHEPLWPGLSEEEEKARKIIRDLVRRLAADRTAKRISITLAELAYNQ